MRNSVFLDTSFSIATAVAKDQFHERAVNLANKIAADNTQIITTQPVILEIGNALSKLKYRRPAVGIIQRLDSDRNVSVISLNDELYAEGFKLFSSRSDKEWSLVDCISFVVMREREITAALTADEHFIQAGFRALLRT
ncbi:MAG: type II toxin-antitoxin system VapC family toxin [Pyrinomonadaceae bacterium]